MHQENSNFHFDYILKSNSQVFLIYSIQREKIFLEFKQEIETYSIKNNFSRSGNFFLNLKVLDIDKVREINSFAKFKYDQLFFLVLSFYSFTEQAQNAFLKFLEETVDNLKIILIANPSANLLSTLLSRTQIVDMIETEYKENDFIQKFLSTKKIDRMKLVEIKEILEKEDEYAKEFDKKDRKDRELAEIFLLELEQKLYLLLQKDLSNKIILKNLNDIQDFKKYIKLSSSSPKIIFEYLSLSLIEL